MPTWPEAQTTGGRPTGLAAAVVAGVFTLTMAGGTLPVPLYVLWAPRFGFGAVTTTALFAAYAVGTAFALALLGRLSDQVGRRPVLAGSLVCAAAGSLLFATAVGTAALVVARLLSGIATGMVTAAATASLGELAPQRPRRAGAVATAANLGGLGAGTIVSGLLAQYGSWPTALVFWLHLAACAMAVTALAAVPETVAHQHRPTISLRRPALPATPLGRRAFLAAGALMFAGFAVTGMFASLVPSFLRGELGVGNEAVVGATVGLLFLAGMFVQLLSAQPWWRAGPGVVSALLVVGIGLVVGGLWPRDLMLVLLGTALAGGGFGLAVREGVATAGRHAEQARRADLVATLFLSAYAGTTVSTIGLGLLTRVLTEDVGTTIVAAAVAVAAVAAVALRPRDTHET